MRWRHTPEDLRPRVVRMFAWMPERCNDGFSVWLEHFWVVQEWGVIDWAFHSRWSTHERACEALSKLLGRETPPEIYL